MPLKKLSSPPPLPPRPIDGHKGLFGRVLIVGGSTDMIGAPALAGEAALRTGSGLVQIALPQSVLANALGVCPELIGLGLNDSRASVAKVIDAAEKATVVAVGPGLGQSAAASRLLKALFQLDKPMVIDADALNYLASLGKWPKTFKPKAVLTPHPGEMKRLAKLFGQADVPADEPGRIKIAVKAATEFGHQTIVLKGHRTVVTDAKSLYLNQTGDSSLSKAGAGDVLTGILASLIGQGMHNFEAACAASYLHGKAGELAGKELGRRSVLARDVVDWVDRAIQ
jgi:ADP-dependent NAD(P)H-hydrate dehydratase